MEFGLTAGSRPIRVMLVEDEQPVADALARAIRRAGMETAWASCGAEIAAVKTAFVPDVILVDLALPDVDGVSVVKWLVEKHDCGVIVVSGAGDEADRVVGLELGADDYVAKPPNVRELVARIRAVHRRTATRGSAERPAPAMPGGPAPTIRQLRIDCDRRTVHAADGSRIAMTAAEFSALERLFRAEGRVVSRDDLSMTALHRPWRPEDRSVDQLILGLRHKIGKDAEGHNLIESIRGAGYLLRIDPAVQRAAVPAVRMEGDQEALAASAAATAIPSRLPEPS